MRRILLGFVLSSSLALVAGCEDGPNQPFKAAPDNAGNEWNDKKSSPVSADAGQSYVSNNAAAGSTLQDICTGAEKAKRWKAMGENPLIPYRGGAGIDMRGGDSWTGITVSDAEKLLCQGDSVDTDAVSWGDQQQVIASFNTATRKINSMMFLPGYEPGVLTAKSREGADEFQVRVNKVIAKNGAPFLIHWKEQAKVAQEANELGDALFATYLPPAIKFADNNHVGARRIIIGKFGDVAYLYMPLLGIGLWTPNQNADQPAASLIDRVDVYLQKVLPFYKANPMLKLDQTGPVASQAGLGPNQDITCDLRFHITWGDFLKNCVKVSGDAAADTIEENKLIGGMVHDRERFLFDVSGLRINFEDTNLDPDDIVRDSYRPDAGDRAAYFRVDQSLSGAILNDRVDNDITKPADNHGAGLIYLEYARLVQEEINKFLPAAKRHQIGDPACLGANAQITDTLEAIYPDGCTGFEGFVTCAAPAAAGGDPNLGRLAKGTKCAGYGLGLGMKPGRHQAAFCPDPDSGQLTGCALGDIWQTSLDQVLRIYGKGHDYNVPPELRDVRFYFKQYVRAIVRYLKVAGNPALETAQGVHDAAINTDDLHFDSAGAGQWETAEYIDRDFVTNEKPPVAFHVTSDIKNGIFNDYSFGYQLYRAEKAMYEAVREDPTTGLGKEPNATFTNIFGSTVLRNGWVDSSTGKSAWECATTKFADPAVCDGQMPPMDKAGSLVVDEDGQPLLYHYKAAFDGKGTAFTIGSDLIRIASKDSLFKDITSAKIVVPIFNDPYNPASGTRQEISLLVPWGPKQPGVGYSVPVDGQNSKFFQTHHLDLTGMTISAEVAWDWKGNPETDQHIVVKAALSSDFLGNIFLCQDSATSDLLYARMYSPTEQILDWLIQHPNATQECGMIIRYSPFGNYPDYITSTVNGITVGITQGSGKGRVVDVILFPPQ